MGEGLEKNSSDIVFNNNIGTALVMKKQYDEAVATFEKILEQDPDNQLAKNNIAWAMAEKRGNNDRIINYF